jgi:hypothetical protein
VSLSLKAPEASPFSPRRVRLEAFYHHLTLRLVIPEVAEDLFLIRIIYLNPLRLLPAIARKGERSKCCLFTEARRRGVLGSSTHAWGLLC